MNDLPEPLQIAIAVLVLGLFFCAAMLVVLAWPIAFVWAVWLVFGH